MNLSAKVPNKMLAKVIQQYIKRIMPHDEVGLSQEYRVGLTFVKQVMLFIVLTDYKINTIYHN